MNRDGDDLGGAGLGGGGLGGRRNGPRGGDRDGGDGPEGGQHASGGGGAYKYSTLEEVVGNVLSVAQDQHGCRFLQRKFDEGGAAAIALVLPEVLSCIVDLMVDPFGNYLVQKLLDRCSEQQRLEVCGECLCGGVVGMDGWMDAKHKARQAAWFTDVIHKQKCEERWTFGVWALWL